MKITGYNSVVGTGGTVNATVRAVGDINAYGGNGSGLKAVSNALGKWQAAYQQVAEEEDKRTLMSAMDTYNKGRYDILYNDENGVMNTKLDGAAGSVDSYLEREKKLRNDIAGNIKFRTDKYKLVFQDMVSKSAQQGYELVDKHQYGEGEKQRDVVLNNNLQNMLMMVQKNYNNDAIIQDAVEQTKLYVAERYERMGKEYVDNVTKTAASKIGKSVVDEAIARGDYDNAKKYMQYFDAVLTPEMRDSLEKALFSKEKDDYSMSLAEDLQRRYGKDIGAVMNELEATKAFGSDRLMNLNERQHILGMVQNINNTNIAIEKARANEIAEYTRSHITEMYSQGKTYTDMCRWAVEEAGADTNKLTTMLTAINNWNKSAGNKGLDETEIMRTDVMLENGVFKDLTDYVGYLTEAGASQKQLLEAEKKFKEFSTSTGRFSVKLDDWKRTVMGKSTLNGAEQALWDGMKNYGGMAVAEFIVKNNRQPSAAEIVEILEGARTKSYAVTYENKGTWVNTTEVKTFSPAQLAYAGYKSVKEIAPDLFEVTNMRGEVFAMSGDTLYRNIKGALGVTE